MRPSSRSLRAAALIAAGALVLAACADDPTIDVDDVVDDGTTADDGDPGDEPADDGTADDGTADDGTADDGDEPEAGPTPDPELVADPCGPHEDREMDAFIEVAAPVDDQRVSGDTVDLIGCSNVFEATVSWTLYDGDGATLAEGFTTAECGTGCVGAFETEVDLSAAEGEPFAELHVYSESAEDGSRDHLVEIPLVLE